MAKKKIKYISLQQRANVSDDELAELNNYAFGVISSIKSILKRIIHTDTKCIGLLLTSSDPVNRFVGRILGKKLS